MKIAHHFTFLLLILGSPLCYGQQNFAATNSSRSPLEIRVTKSAFWKNGCLSVNVSRVNHSKSRIYFPATGFEGVKIYASVTQAKSIGDLSGPEAWILVYGWTDVVFPEGRNLAPGSQEKRTYCLGENFPVKDMVTNEIRRVRLKGRLQISTGYERILHGRSASCEHGETLTVPANVPYHLSFGDHRVYFIDSDIWCSGQVTLEFPIPCPVGIANADCSVPPPIFPGERDQ
jgi:hypothetical protein